MPDKRSDINKAARFNEGKLRYDLIPHEALKGVAQVLTFGAKKYGEDNWRKGLSWRSVLASAERHLEAFKSGEDYNVADDPGLMHIDHAITNLMFIKAYYKIYPQGDDRIVNALKTPRIALDIDEVLADFLGSYSERYGIEKKQMYWNFSYETGSNMEELKHDKEFWLNIKKLRDVPFEPVMYVTSRNIPSEWTMEWLEKNGLPCVPVVTVPINTSKVEVLKNHNIEVFIDDKFQNFVECTNAGIFTYLMDCEHNKQYEVGHRRIFDLNLF